MQQLLFQPCTEMYLIFRENKSHIQLKSCLIFDGYFVLLHIWAAHFNKENTTRYVCSTKFPWTHHIPSFYHLVYALTTMSCFLSSIV
jgi:hypothetical protein